MIIVYGDSISFGLIYNEVKNKYSLCRTSYLRNLRAAGYQIQNRSAIGSTIDKGLKLFQEDSSAPGNLCVVQFGGNDSDMDWAAISENPNQHYDGKVPRNKFESYLKAFLNAIRERKMVPCLVIPPPIVAKRYFDWVSKDKNAENILHYLGDVDHIFRWHDSYSDIIAAFAKKEHCSTLDFRSCFLAQHNDESCFSLDGIHPNEKGHHLMTEYALEQIGHAGKKVTNAILNAESL